MESEKRLWLKQVDAAESLGWCVEPLENGETLIENFSPAGEDIVFYIDIDEPFAAGVRRLADEFDPDEHAEMWVDSRGKRGVPGTIRELIDDAEEIRKMLQELAGELEGIVI